MTTDDQYDVSCGSLGGLWVEARHLLLPSKLCRRCSGGFALLGAHHTGKNSLTQTVEIQQHFTAWNTFYTGTNCTCMLHHGAFRLIQKVIDLFSLVCVGTDPGPAGSLWRCRPWRRNTELRWWSGSHQAAGHNWPTVGLEEEPPSSLRM